MFRFEHRLARLSGVLAAVAIVILSSQSMRVGATPPTAVLVLIDPFEEGSYYAGSGITGYGCNSNDPDPGDRPDFYHFDWGDGRSDSVAYPTCSIRHHYCDEGSYLVELWVRDTHGEVSPKVYQTADMFNLAPSLAISANPLTVNEGQSIVFGGLFSDLAGSYDEPYTVTWSAASTADGPGGPSGPGSWSRHSPFHNCNPGANVTVFPPRYDVTSVSFPYGDNGNYQVTLEVKDDIQAATQQSVTVSVNNVAPTVDILTSKLFNNHQRTHGYWKRQCDYGPNPDPNTLPPDHVGIQQAFLDYISANSLVWSPATFSQVCADLNYGGSDALLKLRMQLIAVWLNVAANFLYLESPLHHPLTSSATVHAFIQEAENAIINNLSTEFIRLATVADDINSDADNASPEFVVTDPVVAVFSGTGTDPGSDDLRFEWGIDYGTGTVIWERSVLYLNHPASGSDAAFPPGSPGPNFPFSVTDSWTKTFPSTSPCRATSGACKVVLRVTDDDGGVAQDENPLETGWSADYSWRFVIQYYQINGGFWISAVDVTYTAWDSVVVPLNPWTGQPLFGGP